MRELSSSAAISKWNTTLLTMVQNELAATCQKHLSVVDYLPATDSVLPIAGKMAISP
jgi:hypothetical protein